MPTSTSTLRLNISAIKELCRATTVLNGTGTPPLSLGSVGDFYITDTYKIFGPKQTNNWGVSSSLIGPAGSATQSITKFNEVSSYLFHKETDAPGYFTANSIAVSGSTSPIATFTNTSVSGAVALFNINEAPLFVLDSNSTTLSPLSTYISGRVELKGSTYIPVKSANQEFIASDVLHVSGGKVVLGSTDVIEAAELKDYDVIVFSENTMVDSTIFNVVTGNSTISSFVVVAANGAPQSRIGTNLPITEVNKLSTYPAHFTINGSVSSTSFISSTAFRDRLDQQLLTTRQQLSLANLDPNTATASEIATTLNTIIHGLTSHGLIT